MAKVPPPPTTVAAYPTSADIQVISDSAVFYNFKTTEVLLWIPSTDLIAGFPLLSSISTSSSMEAHPVVFSNSTGTSSCKSVAAYMEVMTANLWVPQRVDSTQVTI